MAYVRERKMYEFGLDLARRCEDVSRAWHGQAWICFGAWRQNRYTHREICSEKAACTHAMMLFNYYLYYLLFVHIQSFLFHLFSENILDYRVHVRAPPHNFFLNLFVYIYT
jgi:hypothetical protein